MAARTAPARTAAQHQSLLHFVGNACWSDEKALAKVREMVLPAIEKDRPIEAWIIDDTSFPNQGKHSVGVHQQAIVVYVVSPFHEWIWDRSGRLWEGSKPKFALPSRATD
jgi:SRSO17 transposase